MIEVRELSLSIRDKKIFSDISFKIDRGKTLGIVGESGSGKTMIARSLMRLLPAGARLSGGVAFENRELLGMSAREMQRLRGNRIAMIFQEPLSALNPLHTVEKQVGEAIAIHRQIPKKKRSDRVIELLELVRLNRAKERLGAYPHQLSGGELQRVIIAMAIALKPPILIADEPTTALDASTQKTLISLLRELLRRQKISMLVISHDLNLIQKMADDVIVLKDGEVIEAGRCETIYKAPSHPYTMSLIGGRLAYRDRHRLGDEVLRGSIAVDVIAKKRLLRRNVRKRIIDGVSIRLKRQEALGIVGESGSGKSTIAKALTRLIESKGEIKMLGDDLLRMNKKRLREARADLQMVLQDPYTSLNPRLNIEETISEGLRIQEYKKSKMRAKVIKTSRRDVF